MFNNDNDHQVIVETRQAIERIKSAKDVKSKTTFESFKENVKRFDRGREFFEEYDVVAYEGKVKVDAMFYNQLLQKLDESHSELVQSAIGKLYKSVHDIYEHINILPEIYGRNIDTGILSESIEGSRRKLSKVIAEYLNTNFYKLDKYARMEKYQEAASTHASKMISEGQDPDESIAYSIKMVVIEGLLRKIAFPGNTWSRVQYLNESESYGAVFDQEALNEHVAKFEEKVHNIARIVALSI